MNFKILNLFLFIVFFNFLSAQNELFKNYEPIEPSGEIPKGFVTKSAEIVEDELDNFIQGSKGSDKRNKTEFLINSTFSTRNVLLSGKVLYNDPVTKYINKVADEIFKSNKDLDKSKFRIYAYKSPIVNAFAFNDGLVLVNLGLIAQLENEAQLALILSHEFTHVENEDAIEMYLESKSIDRGEGLYKNTSYDDKMLYKSKYSQEKESTADLQGIKYYKNTKYSLKPVNGVFDVLKYAYLPFDEIPFDTTYFETEHYVFPSVYTLNEINPILPDGLEEEDEDEEILRSHPDAEERREAALEEISIAELKDESKQIYIVSTEDEFKRIRNICRFEMPRMYLLHGYHEMAFYNAYLLENLGFENNDYLRIIKAKAITQMARKVNIGERSSKSELGDIKDYVQGESQQVYYFLNYISRFKKEFNVFATRYAYVLWQEKPKDEVLKNIYEDMAYRMFDETNVKFKDFKSIKQKIPSIKDSVGLVYTEEEKIQKEKSEKEILMDEIREADSKYGKIEKKKEKEKEVEEEEEKEGKTKKSKEYYYKYAFVEFMSNSSFTKNLKSIEARYKKEKDKTLTERETKLLRKNKTLNNKRGYALAIDKVVMVNPLYIRIENNKTNPLKSENGQEGLIDIIEKIDKKLNLDVDIINNKDEILTTENFKNAAVLNEWIGEQFLYDETLGFSSVESAKIQNLINQYDSKYFLWTGVIDLRERKNYSGFFNILFNVETGKVVFKSMRNMNVKATNTLIKSELYHVLNQVNFKRKIK